MSEPSDPAGQPPETRLRASALSGRKPTRLRFAPAAAARGEIAQALGLLALPFLTLTGEIRPVGKGDFRLTARLTARAVQACAITLAPVPAQVDEDIERLYRAEFAYPQAEEAELPPDDEGEPLPEVIDLTDLACEALALALPLYPRAPGAELGSQVFAPPGAAPLTDDVLRPFAGLAGLADRLKKPGGEAEE